MLTAKDILNDIEAIKLKIIREGPLKIKNIHNILNDAQKEIIKRMEASNEEN